MGTPDQTYVHRVSDATQPSHLCCALLFPPSIFPSIRVFSNELSFQNSCLMGNRWGTMGTVSDFIFLSPQITADGDCSHEIKRHLLLGRNVMTNLDSILKSIFEVIDISPGNLDSSLCFFQPSISYDVLCI